MIVAGEVLTHNRITNFLLKYHRDKYASPIMAKDVLCNVVLKIIVREKSATGVQVK